MAENNRPQGSSSHAPNTDWEERSSRSGFGSDSSQHSSNPGASRYGRDYEQNQGRSNISNSDFDRDYENQRRSSFDESNYGRGYDPDQNRGRFGNNYGRGYENERNWRGNVGNPYWGSSDYGRGYESERNWRGNISNPYWGSTESGHGFDSDYNRGYVSNENYGGRYGRGNESGYNTPDYGYGRGRQSFGGSSFNEGRMGAGSGYGNEYGRRNWGNEGFGSSFSNVGNRRNFGDFDSDYNRGGYGNAPYGSSYNTGGRWAERGNVSGYNPYSREHDRGYEGRERNWWDRASDEVASWFGNDDAERRRRMDTSHSNRGRGPRGYKRSDERIREDVNDRLSDDSYVDASDIEVSVNNSEVVLSGNVDSRLAKRRAEDLAESILGVMNVENRIRVQNDPAMGRSSNMSSSSSPMSSSSTSSNTERNRKTS